MGSAGDKVAAEDRPPPDGPCADPCRLGEPGDEEALASAPGDVDPAGRAEEAVVIDPAGDRDAGNRPLLREPGAPTGRPEESGGADAPADTPGEAAEDCSAPAVGAAGLAVPPVPHVAAALSAAAGRAAPRPPGRPRSSARGR